MSYILLAHPPEDLEAILGLEAPPAPLTTSDIRRGESLPVFTDCHFALRTTIEATWGVEVPWRSLEDDKFLYFVRSDSIDGRNWIGALPHPCPCVIPASAMILASHNEERTAHVLCRKDRQLMLFAGILSSRPAVGSAVEHSCMIVSTTAKKVPLPSWWRIPFVLGDDEVNDWLNYNLQPPRSFFRNVSGFPSEELDCFECSDIAREVEPMFTGDCPLASVPELRAPSEERDSSHVIVLRRLPTAKEQPAFNRWLRKKSDESLNLGRPLKGYWPEEERPALIRLTIIS